ncbi:MAG: hypothetical protein HY046_12045 [Acidobacteria bacterium]|nr:hypothetical protein [Acidobacteriota bacterium]
MSRDKSNCAGRFWRAGACSRFHAAKVASPPKQEAEAGFEPAPTIFVVVAVLFFFASSTFAQSPVGKLNATATDSLYTTYTAPIARSEYWVDEGYHLNFYTPAKGVTYETDTAGEFALAWRLGKITVVETKDFFRAPIIHRSYSDIVETEYWPFPTVEVHETFVVYSSHLALLDVRVISHSTRPQQVTAFAYYQNPEFVTDVAFREFEHVLFTHTQDARKWSESAHTQYESAHRDVFLLGALADAWGGYRIEDATREFANGDALNGQISGLQKSFVLGKSLTLAPNATQTLRLVRGVQFASAGDAKLVQSARALVSLPLEPLLAESEAQYAHIPRLNLPASVPKKDWELAYWSAFNLMRGQMMPPEGDAHFNYYVFSREPTWSWGHDGQVLHESLSMLSYAHMDAMSAQDSQRVYIERQAPSGYIGYRVGPYVNRDFPNAGEQTTSAPFFAWTNWEIYRISHDKQFPEDAYRSSAAFANYILNTRNKDGDGFLEWGGHAVLECVRDDFNVIWQLFGHGPDSPKKVKALDLTTMMVKETKSLAEMAAALGKEKESREWKARADKLAELVRTEMWDEKDGFFYHLARDTKSFETKDGVSLRRKEIIGFLPLWAGIATRTQAARLVKHLKNPESFWRPFGVPTLAADDPYYNADVTRCCQWNGAVWLLWDYLVFRGLLDYGYRAEAEELLRHVMDGVTFQLKANHRFWESYSPDNTQLNSPKNYLWDTILARMMIDLYAVPAAPLKKSVPARKK